ANVARSDDFGFAAIRKDAAQLVVGAGPEQRFRIRRPRDSRFVAIRVAQLLQVPAAFVGQPEFFAAGAIGNEGNAFAIGRPMRTLFAPGRFGDALHFAPIGGNGENLPMRRDGSALAGGRKTESFRFALNGAQLDLVFFYVRLNLQWDSRALAAREVQFPQA